MIWAILQTTDMCVEVQILLFFVIPCCRDLGLRCHNQSSYMGLLGLSGKNNQLIWKIQVKRLQKRKFYQMSGTST